MTTCDDPEKRPGDGTEISYLELEMGSEKAVRALLAGDTAAVSFCDAISDDANGASQAAPVRNGNGRKTSKVAR